MTKSANNKSAIESIAFSDIIYLKTTINDRVVWNNTNKASYKSIRRIKALIQFFTISNKSKKDTADNYLLYLQKANILSYWNSKRRDFKKLF